MEECLKIDSIFQLFVDCHGQQLYNKTSDDEIVELKCRKSHMDCEWLKIDYESHSEPIAVNVPIGYKSFSVMVTLVTLLVSWIGSFYIARAITRKAAAIKHRL